MANQNFLEKDLETILFETPQTSIRDRGIYIFKYDHIARQINFGAYGIADLITVSIRENPPGYENKRTLFITIYELKQKLINVQTFLQACRYQKAIKVFAESEFDLNKTDIDFRVVLIGSEVDKSDFIYLPDTVPNLYVYTYKYEFDGIKFTLHCDYSLSKPSFPKSLKSDMINIIKDAYESKNVDAYLATIDRPVSRINDDLPF